MDANTQTQRLMSLVDTCEGTFHAVVALGIENKPRHMAAREELRTALQLVLDQRDELLEHLRNAALNATGERRARYLAAIAKTEAA